MPGSTHDAVHDHLERRPARQRRRRPRRRTPRPGRRRAGGRSPSCAARRAWPPPTPPPFPLPFRSPFACAAAVGRRCRPRGLGVRPASAAATSAISSSASADSATPAPPAPPARRSPSSSRVPSGSAASRRATTSAVSRITSWPHWRQNGPAHARVEQAQVVVDLGGRADGRARVADAVLLADGDGRRHAVDASRRRASPSARGTGGRRPTATRRSAAGPRRRWCRRRATTSPTR